MKKSIIISICGALLICFLLPLQGQQGGENSTQPTLPSGPLIHARAPDFSQWVVTVTVDNGAIASQQSGQQPNQQSNADAPGAKPKNYFGKIVTTIQTGKLRLRETVDETGKTWQTWCVKGLQVTLRPDSNNVIFSSAPDPKNPTPFFLDYSATDFPEIPAGIVTAENFVGIQTAYEKNCLVFKGRGKPDPMAPFMPYMAYIDFKTRYPVAVSYGGVLKTYEFVTPPTAELKLPARAVEALKTRDQVNRSGTGWRPPSI
jgi:hypothetical protein